ncbi:hypothetical protein QZH41_012592 [Actinostola sp. cb2023]|nr:hypothetical protein QZH41_012592 [Actinostola sp. cb2023]
MKKSNPSNQSQRTLFQSWGKQSTSQSKTTRQETLQNSGFDPLEIIDLGDDDEDDGLLVAAMEMETIDSITNGNIAQASTSSHRNVNISIPGTSESSPKEIETLPGFDVEAGDIWIYPTNYPVRDYQFKIVEKALFVNTLVTLPTGLGKTFIAAVLMYNYYRWYPQGKVIFMAPTKPLVAQQIEACYNIMGIPESDTAQMTGNMAPSKREVMWKSKRVFFLTPQVLQNDLGRGSCDADQVVLLVFDEAHKSLGNHAYCQVIREVYSYTRNFRVLALSATPGDDIKSVQQVMTNLLISHMELRSEDSPDIQAYTHDRTVDKIVVALGEDIIRIKTQFLKASPVLEGIVGRLFCNRALWQKDPQRVTKFMLLSGRDQFRKRDAEGYTNSKKGAIEGDFAMGISLYHAYELLHQHGILSFYNFIKSIVDGSKGMARARTEIRRHCEFMEIMDELRQSIERPPDEMAETSALFSQFTSPRRKSMMREAFDPSFRSHPKLLKLEEVIVDHFQKFAENVSTSSKDDGDGAKAKPTDIATRVMIFSQYRDSVGEITAILNKHKPLVRVMSFIGQASTGKSSRGLSQKEQLEVGGDGNSHSDTDEDNDDNSSFCQVVQKFRNGGYNTLVATCVGEEGLDIGDVDLIVCFDAHASPIRLVQRMGRTGRKRNGRIVVLVSEGKEEQVYKRSLSSKKSIHKAIVQGSKSFELYDDNPRMIPRHLTPRVHKMEMTVGKFVGNSKRKRKSGASEGNGNISNFMSKSTSSKSSSVAGKDDGLLTYEELIYWQENFKLPNCEAGITPSKKRRSRNSMSDPPVKEISLNEWMPWQNVPSPVHKIAHSRRTEHLIEILEFIELHSGEDDAYDVEMMSFLNEEDLVGVGDGSGVDAPLIILDDEDSTVTLGDCNDRKKSVNQKKKKRNVSDENKAKDNRKTNSKKSMKTKKLSPQRKWKEYLKSFENEDNDFEPVEKESPIDDQEKNDETEKCCQPESTKEEKPTEKPDAIAVDADGSDNVPVETEIPEQEEEDDTLELSSQGFSQLLPSLTPHNTHVFRSKLLGMDNCVKDVPMPPSLDSLNEISPFTPTKSLEPFEQGNKRNANQDRIAVCRRNIQVSKTVIEEPPNLSEFDER